MDLIEILEKLRFSEEAQLEAYDRVYWKMQGANEMLDNCLEIVWKWLIKEGYIK